MPTNLWPTSAEILRFAPELLLIVLGTVMIAVEANTKQEGRAHTLGYLAIFSLVAAIGLSLVAAADPGLAFRNMVIVDGFGTFFRILCCSAGVLTCLISLSYLDRERHQQGEYYTLIIFSVAGQCIMATANELIMVFVGIEISSIASYILAGYMRDDKRNNESAIKYFLLGSFATAFLLYGVAWIYGLTGSTTLGPIREAMLTPRMQESLPLVGAACALMAVGFAFKVSAAPFQVWAPDVYQGAPAPISAFMSVGPKAAAFAVFLRVFRTAFAPVSDQWEPMVAWIAVATMTVGNFAALRQTNIKRLLAYSSIANAGYILVAVASRSDLGVQAVMFYLAAYVFMTLGAFAIISHYSRAGERFVEISDLSGLAQRQPVLAGLFTIFALSMIGVPLTAGFFGKFYIFKAALDSNWILLTIFGLLNSALAAWYYLQLLVVMYMREPGTAAESMDPVPATISFAAWTAAAATLALGIFPDMLLNLTGLWTLPK
jgi:NADH-quinone oxidoreductase subunit N